MQTINTLPPREKCSGRGSGEQLQSILVVGGAGYIGSHMVLRLKQAGFLPVVLDNFSKGHRHAVSDTEWIEGDLLDKNKLESVLATRNFLAVMHFASLIQVGESVSHPAIYYQNNVAATLNLLSGMLQHRIKYFIFSSSAAVYGEPCYTPIDEQHPLLPMNPYGHSKRMVEQILEDFSRAYDFHYTALRYFNAAGADPNGQLFECHEPETHLIPLVLRAASNQQLAVTVYGADYPTRDGTCVRDYIHVNDLCEAHLLALLALLNGKSCAIYNLGTETGYTVQQVIETARLVTECDISVKIAERRLGDPAILVADASLAKRELGWRVQYPMLRTIIEHAWVSMKKNNLFNTASL